MAQELITTFPDELGEAALVPGSGGIFEIRVNDKLIWSREQKSRFPEITELKQLVRDCIAPEKALGHSDRRVDREAEPEPVQQQVAKNYSQCDETDT